MGKLKLPIEGEQITNSVRALLRNRFTNIKQMTSSFMPHQVTTKRPTNYQLYPEYLPSIPQLIKNKPEQMFEIPKYDHSIKIFDERGARFVNTQRLLAVHQVTLDRKESLNALNHSMIKELTGQLNVALNSKSVSHLFIRSNSSPKVFCAGGDVKSLAQLRPDFNSQIAFIKEEFELNYALATSPKDTVAFLGGLVMGGGAGLSLHCKWRIASLETEFSMPECKIGWFTDVGSTFLLARLPFSIGIWMGLTGNSLKAWDLYHLGIVTHVVPEERINNLHYELVNAISNNFNIQSVIDHHSSLYSNNLFTRETLERYCLVHRVFGKDTLNDIFKELNEMASGKGLASTADSEWATQTLHQLNQYSPTSMAVTFELLKRAKNASFMQCIKNEYGAACGMLKQEDFYSGVDARLISKTGQTPNWNPTSAQEMTGRMVQNILNESNKLPTELQLNLPGKMDFSEYPHSNCNLPSIAIIKEKVKTISAVSVEELIDHLKSQFPKHQQNMAGLDNFISTLARFHCFKQAENWTFIDDPSQIKSRI